ncbi:MAG: hypothetical protein ACD_4C00138G0013 [uncultured bacterium (gcode 4)]|uniref:Uncharacterized protein n=1 Tax=uncultured bacterium (gcode 4) TaxID=1234023 RepID=K2G9I1_9BACT|nr:MAG: hypothetical protein ACD_4C00138G0013 [uncultured bacterium (gcode 4)]
MLIKTTFIIFYPLFLLFLYYIFLIFAKRLHKHTLAKSEKSAHPLLEKNFNSMNFFVKINLLALFIISTVIILIL